MLDFLFQAHRSRNFYFRHIKSLIKIEIYFYTVGNSLRFFVRYYSSIFSIKVIEESNPKRAVIEFTFPYRSPLRFETPIIELLDIQIALFKLKI